MRYHIIAFFSGFLLDLILGDPYCFPHPVRLIGSLITKTEKILRKAGSRRKTERKCGSETDVEANIRSETEAKQELWQGTAMAVIVLAATVLTGSIILLTAYWLHPYIGVAAETVMTYQLLAAKCLKVESMKVYRCLREGNLEAARTAVSMIVGRDTAKLDEEGVAKAAVETVAENTSDGVIAPMLYMAVGGPVLGFFYKAANTMDSMVGYKNDKYLYFGKAAARLDDFLNFIPARISACLMLAAALAAGSDFSVKKAVSVYKRDRKNHASPNSAQTESVCAGALGIRLAGDASYFGKTVKKPYIGDAIRQVEYEDIRRANRLMYLTAWICEVLCLSGMVLCMLLRQAV